MTYMGSSIETWNIDWFVVDVEKSTNQTPRYGLREDQAARVQ